MSETQPKEEIYSDQLLGFALPHRNVRGRFVRLDGVANTILSAHEYPPAIRHLLAEALVLAALMGSLVKQDGAQLTMQAQTEGGVVRLLVCDYREGELRGYVDFDRARLETLGANPSLRVLFGKGYLAITFDRPGKDGRYQGIVPLEGETLSEACEAYFHQSEQIPTLCRTAVTSGPYGCVVGGILLQYLAEGEEGGERLHLREDDAAFEHVAIMAGSVRHGELLDPALSAEALVWRLFHEEAEIRVEPGAQISRGCRCDEEHYQNVLAQFPESDLAEMRDDDGKVRVDCAFCARQFPIAI